MTDNFEIESNDNGLFCKSGQYQDMMDIDFFSLALFSQSLCTSIFLPASKSKEVFLHQTSFCIGYHELKYQGRNTEEKKCTKRP